MPQSWASIYTCGMYLHIYYFEHKLMRGILSKDERDEKYFKALTRFENPLESQGEVEIKRLGNPLIYLFLAQTSVLYND